MSNGGTALTDYVVQVSKDLGSSWTTFSHPVSTSPSITVTGLTSGLAHMFRVAAKNSVGVGDFSGSVLAITAAATPNPPGSLVATAGNSSVALTWMAPSSSGASPITNYTIQFSANGGSTWSTFAHSPSTATTATVDGLTGGTSYLFRVAAVNGSGAGGFSTSASATPLVLVPAAPTTLVATPANSSVALSWAAPTSNGGSPVIDYTVQFSANGGSTWSTFAHSPSVATSATVTGLVNGTAYTFRVAAKSAAGQGAFSASALATPSIPVAPNTVANTSSVYAVAIWSAIDAYGRGVGPACVIRPGSSGAFSNPTGVFYVAAIKYSASLPSTWYSTVDPPIKVVVPKATGYTLAISINPANSLLLLSVNGKVGTYLY